MCLVIKEGQEPKIAKRNITVFKVLKRSGNFYRTPYEEFLVKPGDKLESNLHIHNNKIYYALHSFRTLAGASKCVSYGAYDDRQIFRCTIPKGAIYYNGRFYDDKDAYASTHLDYPKKLTPIE